MANFENRENVDINEKKFQLAEWVLVDRPNYSSSVAQDQVDADKILAQIESGNFDLDQGAEESETIDTYPPVFQELITYIQANRSDISWSIASQTDIANIYFSEKNAYRGPMLDTITIVWQWALESLGDFIITVDDKWSLNFEQNWEEILKKVGEDMVSIILEELYKLEPNVKNLKNSLITENADFILEEDNTIFNYLAENRSDSNLIDGETVNNFKNILKHKYNINDLRWLQPVKENGSFVFKYGAGDVIKFGQQEEVSELWQNETKSINSFLKRENAHQILWEDKNLFNTIHDNWNTMNSDQKNDFQNIVHKVYWKDGYGREELSAWVSENGEKVFTCIIKWKETTISFGQ